MEFSIIGILSSIVVVGLTVWICSALLPFLREYWALRKAALQFPSRPRHWLWGTLHHDSQHPMAEMLPRRMEFAEKHNRVFAHWRTSLQPQLFLTHSDTIKHVMKTAEPKATRLKAVYSFAKPWLGEGLLVSSGQKWERNRKLLTPAFHFNVLRPYMDVYNQASDVFMDKVERLTKDGNSIEVFGHVSLFTLDVMLRCSFSYSDNVQEAGDSNPYVSCVRRLLRGIKERVIRPHLYPDFFYHRSKIGEECAKALDYVHGFCDKLIKERQTYLKNNADEPRKRHLDFLDILLTAKDEHGEGLSMAEIRDEANTFLFEGHDTTASAIAWALYALAKYPEMQEKIWQEVSQLLRGKDVVEWNDLPNLKYTALFLKEVLRMYPSVPFISRQTTKPCVIEGVTIPTGMTISLPIILVHYNSDVWDKPKEFRPDRFASEAFLNRDPYCFVPFSAGPRNCIGQNFALNEVKVALSRIVKRFKIELDESHPVKLLGELVLKAEHGVKLRFIPRV